MTPAVVLIDDVRHFVDGRPCLRLRTTAEAVQALQGFAEQGTAIDELWLDFDMGAGTTIRPVLSLLEDLAAEGRPLAVHKATSSPPAPPGRTRSAECCGASATTSSGCTPCGGC